MKEKLPQIIITSIIAVTVIVALVLVANTDIYIKNLGGQSATGNILNTISVSGDGKVFAKPDMATLNITFSETKQTSKDALAEVNSKIQKVKEIALSKGVKEEDIQTTSLNIYAEYDYPYNSTRVYKGQKAVQSLAIKMKHIKTDGTDIGDLIDSVAKVDNILIGSINFDIEDRTQLMSKAREEAYKKADAKASELAKLSNVKLLKAASISDVSVDYNPPVYTYNAASDKGIAPSSTSISTGQLEVNVKINVVFNID